MRVDCHDSFRQLSSTITNSGQKRTRVYKSSSRVNKNERNFSSTLMKNLSTFKVDQSAFMTAILTAYIISPSRGKGVSSSNSSVLYLRASIMMHCGNRFKYRNFCLLVVSSTEFGEVTLKVSLQVHRHQPPRHGRYRTCFIFAASFYGPSS